MTTMVSGVIAVAGATAGCSAYLEFNEGALKFVTSVSKNPTMVLLIIAAVMIVLGTFVDSLAVLLVFAPVAIQISKVYGIDPFQMGLVMVMCNQIGAVSPPTAPLLFVTTEHRPDLVLGGQPSRLVVHAGRDAGAAAGDLHPRPGVVDPALLPGLSHRTATQHEHHPGRRPPSRRVGQHDLERDQRSRRPHAAGHPAAGRGGDRRTRLPPEPRGAPAEDRADADARPAGAEHRQPDVRLHRARDRDLRAGTARPPRRARQHLSQQGQGDALLRRPAGARRARRHA